MNCTQEKYIHLIIIAILCKKNKLYTRPIYVELINIILLKPSLKICSETLQSHWMMIIVNTGVLEAYIKIFYKKCLNEFINIGSILSRVTNVVHHFFLLYA